MKAAFWLSEVLELFELVLLLGEGKEVAAILDRLGSNAICIKEATQELRELHLQRRSLSLTRSGQQARQWTRSDK